METLVEKNTPLSAYLEDAIKPEVSEQTARRPNPSAVDLQPSFAPSRSQRTKQLHVAVPGGHTSSSILTWVSFVQKVYAQLVSSTLGKVDNERFLEHFRYIIIASHLLAEHITTTSLRSTPTPDIKRATPLTVIDSATFNGVLGSLLAGFVQIWLIDRSWNNLSTHFAVRQFLIFCGFQLVIIILLYGFVRRHWLKYLRRQAVQAVSDFVDDVHSFESAVLSSVRYIQEIEVVSRGYQVSPLPPATRLETDGARHKCSQLRRTLIQSYSAAIPRLDEALQNVRTQSSDLLLERILEVYDVKTDDNPHGFDAIKQDNSTNLASLSSLRLQQYRLTSSRRMLMCCLLAVPATGRKIDATRWRVVVFELHELGELLRKLASDILRGQQEEDDLPLLEIGQAPARPLSATFNPHYAAFNINARTMHAKLHLMRAEAARMALVPSSRFAVMSFREEFASFGSEINNLKQMWELGLTAINDGRKSAAGNDGYFNNIEQIGQLQQTRPPSPGGPAETIRLWVGRPPASPPLSVVSESGDEVHDDERRAGTPQASEREIFEAVAVPIRRISLSREQRLQRKQDDGGRLAKAREQRDASTNMIKELQAVINLRPSSSRRSAGKHSPSG